MTIIHPKYFARNYPLILNRVICRFMVSNNIKYAIVLDRRTERVIVVKLNPADFHDEEIEECDWEQILYPYEEEGKFDLTYCDWMFVPDLIIETLGFGDEQPFTILGM